MKNESIAYCSCSEKPTVTTGYEDDWGYWDVCVNCGKRLVDGYHFYNHYDGEDHESFWTMDGDIESDNE